MEQKQISIDPASLKLFTKHLCIISKKYSDREAAHEELNDQLSRIKQISESKKLSKTALKSEIKDLEKKIGLVLKKEAELYQSGKIERMMIRNLKDKVEKLEQQRSIESSKKDAQLSAIQTTLSNLEKKQNPIVKIKGKKQTIAEVETKPTTDKEQIRNKIQELESKYNSLKGKYSETVLSPIAKKIADLKQRL